MNIKLAEKDHKYIKIGLAAFAAISSVYSITSVYGFITKKHGASVSKSELEKDKDPDGVTERYGNVAAALFKEEPSVTIERFNAVLYALAGKNNVTVDRISYSDFATALGTDSTKIKGAILVNRDADILLKGSMASIYRTVASLSSTRIPFKLLNFSVISSDNGSADGLVTATLKVGVFTKGD